MKTIWFKIFFRNSKKNWLNIVVNILGLTLGLAGLLIVLLYLNDEQQYNSTNTKKENVHRVGHKMPSGGFGFSSTAVEGEKYKEEIPEITSYYLCNGWYEDELVKLENNQVYTRDILRGEPNFFDFFPFEIIEGSVNKFSESRNHIAISNEQSKLFFKGDRAIGKSVEIEEEKYIITAVYKIKGKHYFEPSVVMQFNERPEGSWGSFSYTLFCMVTEGANSTVVENKMEDIFFTYRTIPQSKKMNISTEEYEEIDGVKVFIENLKNIRLHSKSNEAGPEGKGNYQLILVMLGLSILLIIISCVNFINLSIASASQRAKEVGVKKTLGVSKRNLVVQYVLEIMFQGLIAFVFALILVELILPSFNFFIEKEMSLLNGGVLPLVSVIAFIMSIVIGVIPAIYVSNFKSVRVLKGNTSRSKKGVLARNVMLVIQFIISGFFLITAMIINVQVDFMINKNLGFSGEQIVVIKMNSIDNRYEKYKLIKNELLKYPDIEVVTSNYFIPGGGNSSSTNADYKDISTHVKSNAIDYEYLDMTKIKILKGRNIKPEFASDTIKNILINETFAKTFNIYDNPIGKKINIGFGGENNDGRNMNVIGMIKDYHVNGFDTKISPVMFFHWNSFDWMKQNFYYVQFKIRKENVQSTLEYIEDYWKNNIEQGYPFEYEFLDKRFARTYEKYKKQQTMFLVLSITVIMMSLLGLFALSTLTIQQRLKEVAIRKTLGASVKEIMIELIKGFLKISVIASVLLLPITYYLMQIWLDNFVYRTKMPWWPYITAPIVLFVLVILVVGFKAYRATKVDLIKYLKFE